MRDEQHLAYEIDQRHPERVIRALFDLPWERALLDAGYLPQGL